MLWRHAFKNAFGPTWTLIGLVLGNLLGGIAVVETVFTIPGLGRLLVDSIFARDYPGHPGLPAVRRLRLRGREPRRRPALSRLRSEGDGGMRLPAPNALIGGTIIGIARRLRAARRRLDAVTIRSSSTSPRVCQPPGRRLSGSAPTSSAATC